MTTLSPARWVDRRWPDRARRPFWVHQLAEYVLGLAVVLQGLQFPEPLVPTIGGLLVLINAAVVRGPLSAFRVFDRAAHSNADLVVMVLLVLLAVQPVIPADSLARGVLVLLAVLMAVIWYRTDFGERRPREPVSGEDRARAAGRLAGLTARRLRGGSGS